MDEHEAGDASWSGRAEGLVVSHPTGSQRGWKKLAANTTYGPVLMITDGHNPLAALGSMSRYLSGGRAVSERTRSA